MLNFATANKTMVGHPVGANGNRSPRQVGHFYGTLRHRHTAAVQKEDCSLRGTVVLLATGRAAVPALNRLVVKKSMKQGQDMISIPRLAAGALVLTADGLTAVEGMAETEGYDGEVYVVTGMCCRDLRCTDGTQLLVRRRRRTRLSWRTATCGTPSTASAASGSAVCPCAVLRQGSTR